MDDSLDRLYEQTIVLRCQAGDVVALEKIVERYHERLRYYVLKMLGPGGDADDLMQELWVEVLRSIPRLKEAGALRSWLYRIAHTRVMAGWRRTALPISAEERRVEELADEGVEFSQEDAAHVHAALDSLTHSHREVLVLRFLEGMEYEQIAGVLGQPVGTVRSRLYYAKRALKNALERMDRHE